MYATLLLVSLAAALSVSEPSIPQECMEDIKKKYTQELTLSRDESHDHTAIMKKVMEQIDFTKCTNIQFKFVMSTETPETNNQNVSYKQHDKLYTHDRPKNIRGDDSDRLENTDKPNEDQLNEDIDVIVFKVKDPEEDQAYNDRNTQNHHNFHRNRKDRDLEEPQQSFFATDNINQFDDEEKYDNSNLEHKYQSKYSDDDIDEQNTSHDVIDNHENVRQNANYRNGKRPYFYNTRQIDDTYSEYNTEDLKYKRGESNGNNYNARRPYDTQSESSDNNYYNTRRPYNTESESNENNYYNTRKPYDTQIESNNNNYYNTRRPYYTQSDSNDNNYYNTGRPYDTQNDSNDNNYYNTGRPYDTQSESNDNYYTSRPSDVPYDSTSIGNHNVQKTDVNHKSTEQIVNQDHSGGNDDSNNNSRKKIAETTLKKEPEETYANDEVTNKYADLGKFTNSKNFYHDTSTDKHDYSNNNNNSKYDTSKTDATSNQAISRYVNQNEVNNNNYSERPMDKDFHTFDDGKSSQTTSYNNNENEQLDHYEKQTEKNIDLGVENKKNIDYYGSSEDFNSDYTEESQPDERPKKLNPQNNHNWQIVQYTTTEMTDPVENSTEIQKTNSEIVFGKNKVYFNDNKDSDTIVNKQNHEQNRNDDKTKDTEKSDELEKKDVNPEETNSKDDKLDTTTIYHVQENPESSSTISKNEYDTPSESKQEKNFGEVQTETTNLDHSEKKNYVVSDTGHTDMPNFDGSEKIGMDSEPKHQNNDQTGNNAVPIQDNIHNHNIQKGNQNSVPDEANSSQFRLNDDSNTNANLVNNEIYADQYQTENSYLAVVNKVFNSMSIWICSFFRLIRSFFETGG